MLVQREMEEMETKNERTNEKSRPSPWLGSQTNRMYSRLQSANGNRSAARPHSFTRHFADCEWFQFNRELERGGAHTSIHSPHDSSGVKVYFKKWWLRRPPNSPSFSFNFCSSSLKWMISFSLEIDRVVCHCVAMPGPNGIKRGGRSALSLWHFILLSWHSLCADIRNWKANKREAVRERARCVYTFISQKN